MLYLESWGIPPIDHLMLIKLCLNYTVAGKYAGYIWFTCSCFEVETDFFSFKFVLEFHSCLCSNSPSPVNVKLLDHRIFAAFVICTSTSLVWSHLHGNFLS